MNVRDLYPKRNEEYFSVYSYQPMVDAMGKILVQVSDNDYQGDTRVLLEKDSKLGVLIFGWGSCSFCDALQACENWDDLSALFEHLQSEIKWFDSAEETFRYFMEHDWEGDYSWHSDETQRFISECKEKLAELIGEEDPEVALQKRDDEKEDAYDNYHRQIAEAAESHEPGCETRDGKLCSCSPYNDMESHSEWSGCSDCPHGVDTSLKMYVWEDVLSDYTSGIVVSVASSLGEALSLVRTKDEIAYDHIKNVEPKIITSPDVFVLYGGS